MLLLNNPYLDADQILIEFQKIKHKEHYFQKTALEIIQNKLKATYFEKTISNEEALHLLNNACFSAFPRLRMVIRAIFLGHPNISIPDHLQDWQPTVSFEKINHRYRYFNADLSAVYNRLTIACHKMSLLIEKQALDHEMAYKLMVLFYDPTQSVEQNFQLIAKSFKQFLKIRQDKSFTFPYHDTFVTTFHQLPIATSIQNLDGWKIFVQNTGIKGLPFFVGCSTTHLPFANLNEAQQFLFNLKYPLASQNPALAALCKKLLISSQGFHAGLQEIKSGWPRKTTDNLPMVDIPDSSGQYFWVKLPPQDMRALYLGNLIPGCCQFINGASSRCVKDGISFDDNGFYVLLKNKKNHCSQPRILHHEINDTYYDIVAQSYAWISKSGNLCLDSIEWDTKRVNPEVIQDVMTRFSVQVFLEHPSIKYINCGTGGQTPRNMFPLCAVPEKIRQGIPYIDSYQQYRIASRVGASPQDSIIQYLTPYFDNTEQFIEQVIKPHSNDLEAFKDKIMWMHLPPTLHPNDFRTIAFEDYQTMNQQDRDRVSTFCKLWNATTEADILQWLPSIPDSDLFLIAMPKKGYKNPFKAAILTRLPLEKRLGILKNKDEHGYSELDYVAHIPNALKNIIDGIPSYACLQLFIDSSYLLQRIASYHEALVIALNSLSPDDQLTFLHSKNNFKCSLLQLSLEAQELDSFKRLLALYPIDERYRALTEKNQEEHSALMIASAFPEAMQTIFDLLPPEKHFAALKQKNQHEQYVIDFMATEQPEMLVNLLTRFSPQTCFELLHRHTMDDLTLLQKIAISHPKQFDEVSLFLTPDLILPTLFEKNIDERNLLFYSLQYPNFFLKCLEHVPSKQQLSLLQERDCKNRSLLYYAIGYPSTLRIILDYYPQSLRLSALFENKELIEALLHHPDSATVILEMISEEDKISFLQFKNRENISLLQNAARHSPHLLHILLESLPQQECLNLLQTVEYGRPAILNFARTNPESFKIILEKFPRHERLNALNSILQRSTSQLPNIFDIILECLPEEMAWILKSRKRDIANSPHLVIASAISIQTFIDEMTHLAPPQQIKEFVYAVIHQQNISEALHQLLNHSASKSVFSRGSKTAIQRCIDKLHPFWLERIDPQSKNQTHLTLKK